MWARGRGERSRGARGGREFRGRAGRNLPGRWSNATFYLGREQSNRNKRETLQRHPSTLRTDPRSGGRGGINFPNRDGALEVTDSLSHPPQSFRSAPERRGGTILGTRSERALVNRSSIGQGRINFPGQPSAKRTSVSHPHLSQSFRSAPERQGDQGAAEGSGSRRTNELMEH